MYSYLRAKWSNQYSSKIIRCSLKDKAENIFLKVLVKVLSDLN